MRHDLLADVKNVLSRVSVAPGSLKLGLSEALVMENPEYAAQILGRLKELGAGLTLTRFGSGYSSMAYLQRFPFDMIRIDRGLVPQDAVANRAVMLRSLVTLAHDFGMETIADGAENESDVIEFSQIDCEYALGFAFGPPLSSSEARKLVGAAAEPVI